mmetsp:Transcript_109751/g.190395  ORF Transcript_109751/g.190395 Transcript_109751/m.190395 type:complete len:265 (-) Transcript_109751:743-1537(-)
MSLSHVPPCCTSAVAFLDQLDGLHLLPVALCCEPRAYCAHDEEAFCSPQLIALFGKASTPNALNMTRSSTPLEQLSTHVPPTHERLNLDCTLQLLLKQTMLICTIPMSLNVMQRTVPIFCTSACQNPSEDGLNYTCSGIPCVHASSAQNTTLSLLYAHNHGSNVLGHFHVFNQLLVHLPVPAPSENQKSEKMFSLEYRFVSAHSLPAAPPSLQLCGRFVPTRKHTAAKATSHHPLDGQYCPITFWLLAGPPHVATRNARNFSQL